MIFRRGAILGTVFTIGLVLATLAFLNLDRPSPINEVNFQRIKENMTLAEVEEILGGPARDESTDGTFTVILREWSVNWHDWISDSGHILSVQLDDNGHVLKKEFSVRSRKPGDFWARLARLLRF
jgi:hypothetical protein